MPLMHIDYDLPCTGCGYNLRTLLIDARCPECSMNVQRTLAIFRRMKPHQALVFLPISLGGAFLFAVVFTVAYLWDKAEMYDEFLWYIISVAGTVALLSGLLAWPVFYYCLRNRKLKSSILLASTVGITEIILVTAVNQGNEIPLAWFGSYPALIASLLFCRFTDFPLFRRSS